MFLPLNWRRARRAHAPLLRMLPLDREQPRHEHQPAQGPPSKHHLASVSVPCGGGLKATHPGTSRTEPQQLLDRGRVADDVVPDTALRSRTLSPSDGGGTARRSSTGLGLPLLWEFLISETETVPGHPQRPARAGAEARASSSTRVSQRIQPTLQLPAPALAAAGSGAGAESPGTAGGRAVTRAQCLPALFL